MIDTLTNTEDLAPLQFEYQKMLDLRWGPSIFDMYHWRMRKYLLLCRELVELMKNP